ncbi:MAG TPA: ABC transporter permease [Candidatus Solibacter sp.]|nr:ABC transporter permease [Candidatus Solibacter sp.]
MRNTWLIIKREYLQRVRTRAFLILTLLLPGIMTVLMALPAKMATMGAKAEHLVLVTSTREFGEQVRQQLLAQPISEEAAEGEGENKKKMEDRYSIDVDANPTDAERSALRQKIGTHEIDDYLWLADDAIAAHNVTWNGREMPSGREKAWLSDTLSRIALQQALAKKGVTAAQADEMLTPVKVDSFRVEGSHESKNSGGARILEIVVMIMLIYMAVLFYGISVMRSVLEEKNSRIMEVLLSSATSTELMAGKILGVGAVGLTQILAWTVMAGMFVLPSLAMQPNLSSLELSPFVFASFAVFFLLGYLLYSTMYAAIGAITTTEQEGQQLQFLIVIPLVLSVFMLMPLIRTPDSAAMVWMSMIPFFAPIVMFGRIVMQTPPLWQILLCVVLLIGTEVLLLLLCARIYRIGVLIYGKRATLPEVLKWLKYAKA